MSVVRKSLLFSLVEAHLGILIQLASIVLLARLLTPNEIGIYSVAAAVVILSSMIRDFGVAEYLIQEKLLTKEAIQAALAVQLIVSWTLAVALFLGGDALARFYGEPGVAFVIRVQCLNLVLIPFGAVTMAYFRRELKYRPIFIIGIVSTIVSAVTAVSLALMDYGYMSLAWSSVAGVFTTVVLANGFRPAAVPLLPSLKGFRAAFSFGTSVSAIYIVDEFVKHAPSLAIGRSISMESVGFFTRAAGSIDSFSRGIGAAATRVALPYFAAKRRSGSGLKEVYLRQVSYMTGVGWSFCCVLGLLAFPVVRTLYGDQWDQVVPLLQLLCVGFAIDLITANASEVLIAMGLIRKATRLALVTGAVRIGCVLATANLGLQAVCIGLIAASIINLFVISLSTSDAMQVSLEEVLRAVTHSAGIALLTSLAVAGASVFFGGPQTHILDFFLGGTIAVLAWFTTLIVFKHPLSSELAAMARSLKGLVPRRSS